MTIGEKLSRLRREKNFTQEQLADILGVSRQAISKWESDVAYPETDKLIRLSALFHCSIDYLLKDDVVEMEQSQAPAASFEFTEKASNLFRDILKIAPTVLYCLWALLLWAFYDAPLVKLSTDNLYQWFGDGVVYELQPSIRALIALGVIAGVYIVPLALLHRFGNKKAVAIADAGSFVLQVAIFVCAMSLIGVCNSIGLECGKIVVVVATLTGVFVLLQVIFIALNSYFNHKPNEHSVSNGLVFVRKLLGWFKLHRVVAIVVACVLFVGIALSVVLPLTVGNIFRASLVSRIDMNYTREDVVKVLGKPINLSLSQFDTDDGNKDDYLKENYEFYYYSPKVERLIKSSLRMVWYTINHLTDTKNEQIVNAKLEYIQKQLKEIEYKSIKVVFEGNTVECVELDTKCRYLENDKIKWDEKGNKKQRIELDPDEVRFGETPESGYVPTAKVFYADGSYRFSHIKIESSYFEDYTGCWIIEWSDHWGNYTHGMKQSTDTSWADERGKAGDDITYLITQGNVGSHFGYHLSFYGKGEMYDSTEYGWSKYADDIICVTIKDGITNVPKGAFANFESLREAKLPNSIQTIGDDAFYGCGLLSGTIDSTSITTIGNRAFYGCYCLVNVPITKYAVSIGDYAFYGCPFIRPEFSQNLTRIGAHAFDGCTFLKGDYWTNVFVIPASVTYVGEAAFANCTYLRSVKWDAEGSTDNGVFLGERAFYNCKALQAVSLYSPDLREIRPYTFEGCTALESAHLYGSRWLVKLNDEDTGTIVNVNDAQNVAKLLTDTYCGYTWYYYD